MLTSRHFINPHKALTPLFIISLMIYHNNTTIGAFVYLALHGTYCLNWLFKEIIFPDKSFDRELSLPEYLMGTAAIYNYWSAPWILISRGVEPSGVVIFIAVLLNMSGNFFHYCCDAQKYFVLQERKGLITNGFFARSRNLNYLGEIMIYLGFALMCEHWWPLVSLGLMVVFVFLPMMREKDTSLARYKEFSAYKEQSNLLIPKLF